MNNISNIITQLEATEASVAEATRKLKLHLLELESHARDYDFLKNDSALRTKLLTLYRRMISHDLGFFKESETLRFENICRNAHMQMEGLLTYFYNEKFKKSAPQFIAEYNTYASEVNTKLRKDIFFALPIDKNWSRITFSEKNFLFQKYTLDSHLNNFTKVLNNYRNSISHIGYVNKHSEPAIAIAEEVRVFAQNKDINAVLDALIKLKEYVEYNTI